MNREEVVNNIGYQMTHAAIEYIQAHEFSDRIDNFEAGAEWMQKKMIDEVEKYLRDKIILYALATTVDQREEWFNNFRKAMEEWYDRFY